MDTEALLADLTDQEGHSPNLRFSVLFRPRRLQRKISFYSANRVVFHSQCLPRPRSALASGGLQSIRTKSWSFGLAPALLAWPIEHCQVRSVHYYRRDLRNVLMMASGRCGHKRQQNRPTLRILEFLCRHKRDSRGQQDYCTASACSPTPDIPALFFHLQNVRALSWFSAIFQQHDIRNSSWCRSLVLRRLVSLLSRICTCNTIALPFSSAGPVR